MTFRPDIFTKPAAGWLNCVCVMADRIISCIRVRAAWLTLQTQRSPFPTAASNPSVAKEAQPITREDQQHGHPPFCLLLKVFDCPAQLSRAACVLLAPRSAILLHRWKCLTLRTQTWAASFPAVGSSAHCHCRQQEKQKWDVRGFVCCKMAT